MEVVKAENVVVLRLQCLARVEESRCFKVAVEVVKAEDVVGLRLLWSQTEAETVKCC